MHMVLYTAVLSLLAGLGACAWVKPTAQAEQVRVLGPGQVTGCAEAGTTHVSVLDTLGKLRRSEDKVATELATLARNSAVQLGGNAVVPVTGIVDGAQTFAVYKCKPEDLRDAEQAGT